MSTPEHNPYAAPATDIPVGVVTSGAQLLTDARLHEIRQRLDEHLAQPSLVAEDARAVEPRIRRRVKIVIGVLAAISLFVVVPVALYGQFVLSMILLAAFAVFVGLIAWLSVRNERKVLPRISGHAPAQVMTSWLHAVRQERSGHVWASFSPSARAQDIPAPTIHPVVTAPGAFLMGHPDTVKNWLRSFATTGFGQVRMLKIVRTEEVHRSGDVAVVQADVRIQSWPRWANILSIVLFVIIRIVGIIVGAILYYSLRRRTTVRITKTLLLGRDGRWYFADANLSDGELVSLN